MSAEERRESVVRAAITEFARSGYGGTSTASIARRVGVSQPYLFRLFPSKQAIFLAAATRCLDETRRAFERAVEGVEPDQVPAALDAEYQRFIEGDRDMLLMQMQIYVAVASADAAGDEEVGAAIRAGWAELWDWVHLRLGADSRETTVFMAHGMLINVLVCLGFPAGDRVWTGFDHKAGN
ncbi:TetR/AcrR family transcriptional regulator [Streptomyces sp. NPDC092296]|uniref:TetR/AcrR family transcriptional regulator n=1 Tax=Streptomyces sp. NPDC092296 TaxID=3366012 RepID=UPI00380DA510